MSFVLSVVPLFSWRGCRQACRRSGRSMRQQWLLRHGTRAPLSGAPAFCRHRVPPPGVSASLPGSRPFSKAIAIEELACGAEGHAPSTNRTPPRSLARPHLPRREAERPRSEPAWGRQGNLRAGRGRIRSRPPPIAFPERDWRRIFFKGFVGRPPPGVRPVSDRVRRQSEGIGAQCHEIRLWRYAIR